RAAVDDGVLQVERAGGGVDLAVVGDDPRQLQRAVRRRHLAEAADGDAVQRAVDVAGRRRNRAGSAQRAAVDDGVLQVERAGGGVDLAVVGDGPGQIQRADRRRHLAAAADGYAVQRAVAVAGRLRYTALFRSRAAVDDGVLQVERAGGGV